MKISKKHCIFFALCIFTMLAPNISVCSDLKNQKSHKKEIVPPFYNVNIWAIKPKFDNFIKRKELVNKIVKTSTNRLKHEKSLTFLKKDFLQFKNNFENLHKLNQKDHPISFFSLKKNEYDTLEALKRIKESLSVYMVAYPSNVNIKFLYEIQNCLSFFTKREASEYLRKPDKLKQIETYMLEHYFKYFSLTAFKKIFSNRVSS